MSKEPGDFQAGLGPWRWLGFRRFLAAWPMPAIVLPVPAVTIYPGDTIRENAIVDHDFGSGGPMQGAAIKSRAALIGKVARHTLLPGLPISFNAVGEPRLVVDGQKVRVIFEQDGLDDRDLLCRPAGGRGRRCHLRPQSRQRADDFRNCAVGWVGAGGRLMVASLPCSGLLLAAFGAQAAVRIKDISSIEGVRDNQLLGYGLVVGLQNTGDTLLNSTFTQQALQSMLDRMGINVRGTGMRTRNVAGVLVTADVPPFVTPGTRIDVTVSSLGDATSLMGGTLILTSLNGVDGQTYAIAQGQVAVSGYSAAGQAESVTENVPTAGRIANGALMERPVPGDLADLGPLTFELKNPDFATAARVADAINAFSTALLSRNVARQRDQRSIDVDPPPQVNKARFIAEIGELDVEPDMPARVVMDARSGAVVISQDVQISTVAVTYGNITVRVTETPQVSQPAPFSHGRTVVVPNTQINVDQPDGTIAIVHGPSLRTLVAGLNQIGLKPSGIIAILQAIKAAGALQADLIVE